MQKELAWSSLRTVSLIAVLMSVCLPNNAAIVVTTGAQSGLLVRGFFDSFNPAATAANDFEFQACTREGAVNPPAGARSSVKPFSTGDAKLAAGGCVDFRFAGGEVGPGGGIRVNVDLFLTKQNSIVLKNRTWTHDQLPIASAGPSGGWSVGGPVAGGNGGVQTLAGNGEGGQEGGGGSGNYIHAFEIINLDSIDRVLTELKLLASTTFYDDLAADVPWSAVDAINLGASPLTIAANSSYIFDFNTTGSYDNGGHIYSSYSFASPQETVFGDHPVERSVPEVPTVLLVLTGLALLRRHR